MKRLMFVLFFVSTVVGAVEPQLNASLAFPPELSIEEIILADTELMPEHVEMTKIAFASDYDQKVVDVDGGEVLASPYFEAVITTRRGRKHEDTLSEVSVYMEIPVTSNVSFWASVSRDSTFRGTYLGFAKKQGDWQIALGGGFVRYDDMNHFVINPWMSYSNESYEGYLHAEYYHNDSDNPWWYKGYLEKKFGDFGFGIYGEAGLGLGPRLSWKATPNLKFWVTTPVVYMPEHGKIGVLAGVVISF